MAYTAAVLDSQIDVSDIRDLLVQGDTAFPTINFTLPAGFTGLTWRVRGTFMQFNLATQSEELAVTGSTTVSIVWPVGSNFTTYYGEMQIVLVGTDALGNIVTKATGYVNVRRDFSISTVEVVDENLFEQLMAELSSSSLMLDQATEQKIINGVPKLAADREISDDHHLADKKYVDDHTPPTPVHNDLGSLQGGSSTERYHMTQAENTALHAHSNKTALGAVAGVNTGDQAASSFNHNDLANKQGGTTNEFYHVTSAEKTVIQNTSGTNTGDQDVSGAISAHNGDAGAHGTTFIHSSGNETKTGGLEVTNGLFASGYSVDAMPVDKNGIATYWNTQSPIGGISGGIGRIAAFIKSALGVLTYKAIALGAYLSGSDAFALLLNADGSAKFGNGLDMNSKKITGLANPTVSTDAATKGYTDGIIAPFRRPLNGLYDGVDLSTVFASAADFRAAVAAGDFSKIKVGDYWPVTLSGTFRDYSSYTVPSGVTYYSDAALTVSVGTTATTYEGLYTSATAVSFTIISTTYYVAMSGCLAYYEKTISNAILKLEVGGINPYYNYGDTALASNHIILISRDCLPIALKMWAENSVWYNTSATNPWLGSALYETLNNSDYGLVKLISGSNIGAYIYAGPNSKGMRWLGETKAAGVATPTSWSWLDRGKIFLPFEPEIWGQSVFADNYLCKGVINQLDIFRGTSKHIVKGLGNGGSRCYWWCASAYVGTSTYFAGVNSSGNPGYSIAVSAYGVPACFLIS